jgi:tetratricopeptide (TPR) repeat protein/transglutaminase-like putative cysteine protease
MDLRRFLRAALVSGLTSVASAGFASDVPLYQPAPAWVTPAPLNAAAKPDANAPALVIFDMQHRIENGRLWSYSDNATRIVSPEALSEAATLALSWAPDKGDLVIHELSIQRGSERIDLLAKGQKFTVLRREQSLEQRELTGILTATLAVEGLQVGDILRLRSSTSEKDDALGGRVQDVAPILAAPAQVGFARIRVSWPTAAAVRWKLLANDVKAAPIDKGGYTELLLQLPAAKQIEMPNDAPGRYLHAPMLELATFADWADVSKTFAPLFATQGQIAPGTPLEAEVAAIRKAETSPIGRAQRALELVQDKIRYLAVGMDGGNYVPQKPARTWDVRYGDCKAKTVLLLAILRELGIDADAVLANVGMGDLVPDRLPSAAAFNHVFVRARIGGDTLWLDGTASGSRIGDIHDTPQVGYVLPISGGGAALVKVAPHANARPLIDLSVDADESASVDVPSVFAATAVVQGPLAAMMTMAKSRLGEKEQRDAVEQFLQGFMGEGQFVDTSIVPDPVAGTVTIKARGLRTTAWQTDDRRRKRQLTTLIDQIKFDPDRSKTSWAAIPVAVPAPGGLRYRLRLHLPEGGRGFALEGVADTKEQIAGYDIARKANLTGDILTLEERVDSTGGEIPVARIPVERDAVATAKARAPRLIAPADTRRRWNLTATDPAGATQIAAARAVLAKAIATADTDEVSGYQTRASLLGAIGDHPGALADLTRALAIAPTVELYLLRANQAYQMNDLASALADAEAARALDPSSVDAIGTVSRIKAERGDVAGAAALLDDRIARGGDMRNTYRGMKASMLADYGNPSDALALYDSMISEKPGSPSLLNGRCWTKGTHQMMLESALKDCTQAIELSDDSSAALDSRAMVWYRLGKYTEALADLDAVLGQSPAQAASLFMRSIVLKQVHRDAEATRDLALARRIAPTVDRQFARFGIKPS